MTLNKTLIPWITQANRPGGVPPLISFDASVKPDQLKAMQVLLGAASFQDENGNPVKISASWLRETFNIPEPDEDAEDVLEIFRGYFYECPLELVDVQEYLDSLKEDLR